ncbi:MAG: SDR family oxidoreductase [Bacteroidetes bacterium]|nr:SDR family oxidoreductase [Bacteroidota bacterium]
MYRTKNSRSLKTVIITGVSKGIGHALAEHYGANGYQVLGLSRTEPEQMIIASNFRWYRVDITNEKDVKSFFREIRKEGIKPYALINNAGVASLNALSTTPLSTVQHIFNTNVNGTFLMMKEAAKMMVLNNLGRIVNFSSVAYPLQIEWESAYSASKAAIESFSKTAAREWATSGITVNIVGPGPVETDLVKNVGDKRLDYLLDKMPISEVNTFDDVANVCDFFLIERSAKITGQVIYLGGASQ